MALTNHSMKQFTLYTFITLCALKVDAQLKLPAIIRDSMILQRDQPVPVWGWAAAGDRVTVQFNKKKYSSRADQWGQWKLELPATAAGGPYTIQVSSGKERISLSEVLFGDVWFCSGQSNMVHQMNIHDVTYARDIAEANYPQIRQFWIPSLTSLEGPQKDIPAGHWQAAVGEQVRPFSAVAYFFALKIHRQQHVPIGIINASVGGTPIDAWMSEKGLSQFPDQMKRMAAYKEAIQNPKTDSPPRQENRAPAPADLGLAKAPYWFQPEYQPKGWKPIHIPGYWEDQGIHDLNGTVWYRKWIDLPASAAGQPARVHMGRIVDADELYINGVKRGNTTYMYPQRRYHIPADALKPGPNLFVFRVTNTVGKGGFVPDKPYYLVAGNDTISLDGNWEYKVGAVFPPFRGARPAGGGGNSNPQQQPAALYNAMVAPFINYGIRGICWYQGESDTGRPELYRQLMPALIRDWRRQFGRDTLPFFYVQLPGFMDYHYLPMESNWAMLREAQAQALSEPNTGMAVAIDLGEWNDIHPDNKKDVGERLALIALHKVYADERVYSGPQFEKAEIKDGKIILIFAHTGSGLVTNDAEPPAEFAIAGEDKKFVWAKTRIEGNKVIVWSEEVEQPRYVRYAWSDNPVNPNLYNREGLPASPFRTDK